MVIISVLEAALVVVEVSVTVVALATVLTPLVICKELAFVPWCKKTNDSP